jgi:hypothetical protein
VCELCYVRVTVLQYVLAGAFGWGSENLDNAALRDFDFIFNTAAVRLVIPDYPAVLLGVNSVAFKRLDAVPGFIVCFLTHSESNASSTCGQLMS